MGFTYAPNMRVVKLSTNTCITCRSYSKWQNIVFEEYKIRAAGRNGSKRLVPADEALGHVLTRPVCDCLPHWRRLLSIFFILGSNSSPILVASKCSRTLREAQNVFLGERLAATGPVTRSFSIWGLETISVYVI